MKLLGKLGYWNAEKGFGFIEVRHKEDIGVRIERFFVHASQVVLEPEVGIRVGQLVRFVIRERQLPADKYRAAGSVEIFDMAITPDTTPAQQNGVSK